MLTAGERYALQLWAAWYLEKRSRLLSTVDRAAIDARVAWQLRELVAELLAVAQTKGREIEIPDPLFFRDLLELLSDLEVSPAEFFDGVLWRWGGFDQGSN